MRFRVAALIVDFRDAKDASVLAARLACWQRDFKSDFDLKVFHIDNGNSEPVILSKDEEICGVELIRVEENHGYASGLNAAIRGFEEKFDYYWCLNSDLELEPGTLPRLLEVMTKFPHTGACGPRVFKGRTGKIWGVRGVVSPFTGLTSMRDWKYSDPMPRWSYIPGSTVLFRRTALEEAGGLPSRYRMYYEETEACVRLQKLGWELRIAPHAFAFHKVNSLSDRLPAKHYAFYVPRNNLYFWKRNFGIPPFVQLPRMLFVVLKELVLPLRRSPNLEVFRERLGFIVAGVLDSFEFLHSQFTRREKKLFNL